MELILKILNKRICLSIIIFIIMIILLRLIKKRKNKKLKTDKKKSTYINFLNNILKYVIILTGIALILKVNGINVSSILAGLGIASVITGLALQDALRDIIMGFNIIIDNYFSVGDIVEIEGMQGKVIAIGIKNTKIKNIKDESIFTIANRNIDRVLIISNQVDIDISLEYEEKIEKVEKVIEEIIEEAKENKDIKDIKYMGLQEFEDSAIKYKIRVWCDAEIKGIIKRYVNRIIKLKLEENKINIPYKQIDIHQK